AQTLRLVAVDAETHALQVQHDVDDIFFDARYVGELMGHTFDFEGCDGSAGDAGQQDTTQAIAEGHAVAAVQGLDRERSRGAAVVVNFDEPRCVNNVVCHALCSPS